MKPPAHSAGLPGNVHIITKSAFLPACKAGHPADLPVTEYPKRMKSVVFIEFFKTLNLGILVII
jgi:hypothetical protein